MRVPVLSIWVIALSVLSLGMVGAARADAALDLSERAFEGAQWVMATEAARAVAQVEARAAVGDGPLARKIRARQDIEARLEALRSTMTEGDDGGLAVARLRQASGELDRIDAEIRAAFPEYAEFANPRPLNFAAVMESLGARDALVMFLSDRSASYIWAISKTRTGWHRSDLGAQALDGLVRRVRVELDPTDTARSAVALSASGDGALRFDAEAAHRLYHELLAPLGDVLDGADHVYVVKDGALSSLPLSVLLTEPLAGETFAAEDLRDAPWLLRRHAFTTLASVASLASGKREVARGASGTRFIGFGDPVFAGAGDKPDLVVASRAIDAFFSSSGSRTDALRALSPLPGTARELREIARQFPEGDATLHLGAEATEAAVKAADLAEFSIISFATYGLITGDISGLAEPALAFTPPVRASAADDGLLTASEAAELRLNADWVILSACNTAAGDGTPGAEGLSGLARAFLFAGARSILVSHWPVRDDVAALLTADTLRRLNEDQGLGRAEALRRAVLALMEDKGRADALAHPSAWAPFVLVGDGGAI